MTADVRQQLTEALDEAERIARAATAGPWRYNPHKQWLTEEDPQRRRILAALGMRGEEFVGAGPLDATIGVAGTGPADDPQSMADAAFIARWDPATVLRLVERDRIELRRCDEIIRAFGNPTSSLWPDVTRRERNHAQATIKAAAATWHPSGRKQSATCSTVASPLLSMPILIRPLPRSQPTMPDRQKIIEAIHGLRYGDPVHFGEWAADLADAIITAPVGSATVLNPGDSVLVVLDGDRTMAEVQQIKELLDPRFPGVSITIATGVSEVVVKPAEAPGCTCGANP